MIARLSATLLAAMLLFTAAPARADPPPPVAAASDLKFALEEAAAQFEHDTGKAVKLVFGSSGNFARQIEQGAPFELLLSADEGYVLALAGKGLMRDQGVLYAIGRIALFAPHGSPLDPAAGLDALRGVLARGQLTRFAIANPEHAPYGRAAVEALRHAGLWDAVQPRLVLGENATQAAQYAASGSTEGGIVPYSLALSTNFRDRGRYALLPAEWHAPLRQRMALTRGAGPTARAFYDWLQQPAARAIFARHGFELPEAGAR